MKGKGDRKDGRKAKGKGGRSENEDNFVRRKKIKEDE